MHYQSLENQVSDLRSVILIWFSQNLDNPHSNAKHSILEKEKGFRESEPLNMWGKYRKSLFEREQPKYKPGTDFGQTSAAKRM